MFSTFYLFDLNLKERIQLHVARTYVHPMKVATTWFIIYVCICDGIYTCYIYDGREKCRQQ